MKLFTALVLLLVFSFGAVSQNDSVKQHKIDSLTLKLQKDSLHTFRFKLLRPYANIDNRPSFLKSRPSNFNGLQLGVILNEYHTLGFGLYILNRASRINSPIKKDYRLHALRYYTLFYEYMLVNKRYFEVDLPFELGYGSYKATYTDSSSVPFVSGTLYPNFLPVSAGVKFVLKPVKWVGLSLIVGYRYFMEEKSILEFNNFFFPIGVWVDFRQVYRDVKFYGFQRKRYRRRLAELNS